MPNGMIPLWMMMFAMCVNSDLDVEMARDSLEYRSVMTHVNWLPYCVFGGSPSMSSAIKPRSFNSGKSCKFCLQWYQLPFRTQLTTLAVVV